MILPSHQSGFTLVELLVTLSILTALATAAAVSSAGLRERELTARTIRQGESLRTAIEQSEGLSFVSDLGFVPHDLGTLSALRQQTYDPHLVLEEDGSVTSSGITVRLPLYATCTAPLLPTNSVLASDLALKLTNGLDVVRLGAGWRGPYAVEKFVLKSAVEPCLADPWGGAWELDVTNSIVTVMSRGRDGVVDGGTGDWHDCDRFFSTRPVESGTLVVQAKMPSGVATEKDATVTVSLYEPSLEIPETGVWREGQMTLHSISVGASLATAQATLSFENCCAGLRAIWAYAVSGDDLYAAVPQLVQISAGNTTVELLLGERP